MIDVIVAGIIILIVLLALLYIRKEKKRGIKCVGCPFADACSSKQKDNCEHQSLYDQYKNSNEN